MVGDLRIKSIEPSSENNFVCYFRLKKDRRNICRMRCNSLPDGLSANLQHGMTQDWSITVFRPKKDVICRGLPSCSLSPDPEDDYQNKEYKIFLKFLKDNQKVAIGKVDFYEFYIHPPPEDSEKLYPVASYLRRIARKDHDNRHDGRSEILFPKEERRVQLSSTKSTNACLSSKLPCNSRSSSFMIEDKCSPDRKPREVIDHASEHDIEVGSITQSKVVRKYGLVEKIYAKTDPSYLKTLGQIHSGWMFGAVAELVDNSRDAKATTLKVSIEMIHSKQSGKDIPMLSVIDDGHGMTHLEILRMITFGHMQPDADDLNKIGRFGVGFKSGAMRLGKDALVLTQTATSRSIAFLSQSFNEGKDNLEIPIVSYSLQGQIMEVDTTVQSMASAKYNLTCIKEFSPFNKYLIGEKEGLFKEKGRGTQIYIWNLDQWGSDYCLEWVNGMSGGSSFHKGDILIRSRRCRSRTGQMAQKVQLDFSLRAYLEVMFLDPRMKIYVQGSLVSCRPLAKSLNKTVVLNGSISGKPVQLILGRSQLEWEQGNCGIFLYWHGRLVEAYKRVGSMRHNGDKSHGVIGVIDVSELMNDGKGGVWVHNNKQSFQDCEAYAQLEDWLGEKADSYLDSNFDKVQVRKASSLYKPDHEWVQCDKCRKWRILSSDFDSKTLPLEWFCYMKPFSGGCEIPEQEIPRGVITVSAKRAGTYLKDNPVKPKTSLSKNANDSSEEQNNELLIKNHESRPTGSTSFPKANVMTHNDKKSTYKDHAFNYGRGRGRGRGRGCGFGHGRGFGRGREFDRGRGGQFKNTHSHQKWERKESDNVKNDNTANICYRCGGTGHWSRTCRTPKHLVELYQQSK